MHSKYFARDCLRVYWVHSNALIANMDIFSERERGELREEHYRANDSEKVQKFWKVGVSVKFVSKWVTFSHLLLFKCTIYTIYIKKVNKLIDQLFACRNKNHGKSQKCIVNFIKKLKTGRSDLVQSVKKRKREEGRTRSIIRVIASLSRRTISIFPTACAICFRTGHGRVRKFLLACH